MRIQQLHTSKPLPISCDISNRLKTTALSITDQWQFQSSIFLASRTQISLAIKITERLTLAMSSLYVAASYLGLYINKLQLPFPAWNPNTWLCLMLHTKYSHENNFSASFKSYPAENLSQYCQTVNQHSKFPRIQPDTDKLNTLTFDIMQSITISMISRSTSTTFPHNISQPIYSPRLLGL